MNAVELKEMLSETLSQAKKSKGSMRQHATVAALARAYVSAAKEQRATLEAVGRRPTAEMLAWADPLAADEAQ